MKKRLLIFIAILLFIPIALFSLMNTEWGSRWLLQQFLPAEIAIENIQGSLLSTIKLTQLH